MKKIGTFVLNLIVFFAFYYLIAFSSIGIQWIGYILNFDRIFGVLFDPTYQLYASSCDRTLNFNNMILFTVSFILIWLIFKKKIDTILKKIYIVSYSVLILTMIFRLLPAGIGSC